jgi:hypothetical protein
VKSRHQRKTAKSQRRKQRLQRQLQVERRASFETLEDRMLLAAGLGAVDLPVAEGEAFGTMYLAPTTHEAGEGYLSGTALGQTPMQVTSDFFTANASQYGLDPSGLGEFRVLSEYMSAHTRVTHLALQQQHNGIDVFGAMANINLDNDGSVLSAASSFVSGLEDNAPLTSTVAVSPQQAFASAAAGMGLTLTENVNVISANTMGQMEFALTGGGIASSAVQGALVYLPTFNGVDLAWKLGFTAEDGIATNTVFVSAEEAQFVYAFDGIRFARYEVLALPTNDLLEGNQTTVVDPATSNGSPFGWHDTNGVEGAEYTITRGNNTHVVLGDLVDGFNPINHSPDGGANLDFDFPFDPSVGNLDPANQDAVITNVFYAVNVAHDVFFNYGFDEAAGNFQASNYTGLPGAGDHIRVQAHDPLEGPPPPSPYPGQACNAFFVPTVDGITPQMVLGFCNTGLVDDPLGRDFGLSNDVIVHEFSHGLTERLVAGPATLNLAGPIVRQFDAMHEGMGDYWGMMFTMKNTQAPGDAIEVGPYIGHFFTPVDEDRVNPGVRRNPYSYDTTVNPIDFDQWNDLDSPKLLLGNVTTNDEAHNAGEIWASTLYDMTWELIAKYGGATGAENFTPGMMGVAFNPDIGQAVSKLAQGNEVLSFAPPIFSTTGPDFLDLTTGANNYAMQLVLDGMKLVNANPSFRDMRDAIMAADLGLSGGVNLDVIWKAFARRGLGFSADRLNAGPGALPDDPVPFNTAYDMPPNPADVAGTAFIDANEDGVQNVGESPLTNTTIFIDLNGNGTHERLEPYTVTDTAGDYNFTFFTGGEFKIRALPVPDFVQTEPGLEQIPGGEPNDGSHDVFVVNGNSTSDIDFGFAPSAVSLGIFGTKYEDVNGNGVQDDPSIEKGMAGVYMYLDIDNDLRIDIGEPAAITDADGHYAIEFHQPGAFTVREVLAPGWATTEPAVGHHDITIVSGLPVLDVNFGNQAQDDYGDAPAPYPTLKADGGAVHGILVGFSLGTTVDFEIDGQPSTDADGDGIDEDGIVLNNNLPLVRGFDADIEITVTNGSNSPGVVQGWIDFNADGDWNDAGEHVVIDQRIPEGTSTLTISVPEEATVGLTYARFRYGYERGIGPGGRAFVGEVEDYKLLILDEDPVANDDVVIVIQNSGLNPLDGSVDPNNDLLKNDFSNPPNDPNSIVIDDDNYPLFIEDDEENAAGTVTFSNGVLFFTPAPNFSGQTNFDYTVRKAEVDCLVTPERCDQGRVTVIVQTIFTDPVLIDDYQNVTGADVNPPTATIDVLANDITGATGNLTINSVNNGSPTTSNGGTVAIINNKIHYTPAAGFYNLDTFNYRALDDNNQDPDLQGFVTVQVSKAGGACDPVQELANCDDGIFFIVETINPVTGTPLTQINVGQEFEVRVSIRDGREDPVPDDPGLYAAFMDVLYDADFVDVKPSATPITYGPDYTIFHTGIVGVPGVVNELGAVQEGFAPLGNGTFVLASIIFIAKAEGTATIQLDPADVSPEHDSLVHEPATSQVVDHAIISYGTVSITVGDGEQEPEGELQLLDASGDGVVSPLDALQIINDLNTYGSRAVTPHAEGEITTPNSRFDVNRDDFITPMDALAVITYLNNHSAVAMQGGGEGEAPADVIALLAADRYQVHSPVNSLTSNENSAAVVDTASQAATIVDQPRQLETARLDLGRWMTGRADADEAASQEDLESLIDSLADDVSEQWNG